MMKLVICIVSGRDKNKLSDALVASGFQFTKIPSVSGFLKHGNVTFLIGIKSDKKEELVKVISENVKSSEEVVNGSSIMGSTLGTFVKNPITVTVSGAAIFVIDVEDFQRV